MYTSVESIRLALHRTPRLPARYGGKLWHTGIATLTVGSLFQDVLEIYGTSSALTPIYWIMGGLLLLSGAVLAFNKRELAQSI